MAYTYLIGWREHDKWYYGVRYAKGSSPSDLWKTYFTSSRHVSRFREEYGEPDVVQVRRVFDDEMRARECEDRVLRRLAAPASHRWLNRHHGGKFFGSQPKTTETRRKMSETRKALRLAMSEETKEKLRQAALKRPARKMGPMSDETKRKIGEANLGRTFPDRLPHSEEARRKMSEARRGVSRGPHSDETKRKIGEANSGKPGLKGDANPSRREEVRAKISASLTGRKRTDEEREAMRRGCEGRTMPKRGPMSEETKRKISDAYKRRKSED